MNRAARLVLCLSLLLLAAAAQKQSTSGKASSAAPFKLIALKVTGTARYTDKEILAASGLQMGQNAADGRQVLLSAVAGPRKQFPSWTVSSREIRTPRSRSPRGFV